MCQGVAYFSNNRRALYAKKTISHSEGAEELKIDEDKFRKFEYLWWEKKINQVHYDEVAENILNKISVEKATKLVEKSVRQNFNTDTKLARWLKRVPDEWDKLLDPKFKKLTKKVNPLLLTYQDKINKFKKQPIEKYNLYKATKLPTLKSIKKAIPKKVRNQVRDQVWNQVRNQVWNQVWDQVWNQVWNQVGDQVRNQVRNQVRDQVWNQVRNQVRDQVWNQVGAISYWAVKIVLGLPIKHWFFDFLKLGVIIVFVKGKAKVFGKKGKYLGEYSQENLFK